MKQNVLMREIGWTIKRVLPLVPKDRAVGKSDFQAILEEVQRCMHRHRKIRIDAMVEKTEKVLSDLPEIVPLSVEIPPGRPG